MNGLKIILNMIRSDAVSGTLNCEDYSHPEDQGACQDYERATTHSYVHLSKQRELMEIYGLISKLLETKDRDK